MKKPNLSAKAMFYRIRCIGRWPGMDEYEKRKLSVFNQLNFLGVFSGLFISVAGLLDNQHLPWVASVVAFSPTVVSSCVLFLNHRQKHEAARLLYFIIYPVLTALVYAAGLDVGVELFFVLYGVLAVFYLKKPAYGLLTFFLSLGCYLLVFIFVDGYKYHLEKSNFSFYVLNHFVAIVFVFFALSWIKRENNNYQKHILRKSADLEEVAAEIERQKQIIAKKVEELSELDALKNKLFSVISHDLKSPIYALRTLFRNAEKYNINGDDLKLMVPDIVKDLNFTTSLMENLLQWSKSQMQADSMSLQQVDVSRMIDDTLQLLRLQAEAKNVYLQSNTIEPVYVVADKDALELVLRNLVSNAIKYTPPKGRVSVETADLFTGVEVSVQDTGVGMTTEVLNKLSENNFYTSKGTHNETGTGLGLMLCKEFLKKLGTRMYIESEQGKGSTFSFTLLKPQSLN